MSNRVLELFTRSTLRGDLDWEAIAAEEQCCYLGRMCVKTRKGRKAVLGTCSVRYGSREPKDLIVCPHRFLERQQLFLDCLHLLTAHEPGNELHIVPETAVPGGNIDHFLVSARERRVIDFVGIEIQALDTTGTVWPARQEFLRSEGVSVDPPDDPDKKFGINWKMTAKTILVQLHHKVQTFEHVNKHLVLVLQDWLLDYMERAFNFDALEAPLLGNAMHFHPYALRGQGASFMLTLMERHSTDSNGLATCLGLQTDPHVELGTIVAALERKISEHTRLRLNVEE